MRWILFSWLALALVATVYGQGKKVAIVEAKEASELVAEHRQLDVEDDDEDQLALESVHHAAEDKDGDHHHEHDHHEPAGAYSVPAPPPPAYAAPAPVAPAYAPPAPPAYAPPPPAYGPKQPLPVPIPVPVKPGALVLPSLPVKSVKYPAPQPVQRPYGQITTGYAPPPAAPVAHPPPPAYPAPVPASAPAPVTYNAPPPAPAVYAPAPAPAYPAPAPAYQPPAPAPQYRQQQVPAYQAPAPQPLPQPAAYQAPPPAGGPYQVPSASQPASYQAPPPALPQSAAYQAAPEVPAPKPVYQPQPQPQPAPYQAPAQPQPAPYQSSPVEQPAPEAQAYQGAAPEAPLAPAQAEQSGSYIGQRNIDPQEFQADTTQLQDTAPAAAVPIPTAEAWPSQPVNEMPKIVAIDVKCEKSLMKVAIQFDKPFYGIIFSKNHYANPNCVHLPAGLGRSSANFDVSINACGTVGNTENGLYGYGVQSGSGTFFENTIIIQYDPQVQEVWDQARKLRCTWHDQYEKSVTFRPFPVDMLDVVRADFAGDNVGCWMQIQVGKGPWASEVSGLVKIGQTMTMVLAIKDDENKFDMLVRNCMAHDGKRAPIQLVDQRGCVTRPKLMSRFTKIKNFGASASVLSYAHFQAFKFPDSMEVHFQCTIQICRYQCPDQCADDAAPALPDPRIPSGQFSERMGTPREDKTVSRARRDVSEKQDVGINKIIQVVSTGDLTFALEQTKDNTTTIVIPSRSELDGLVCMTSPGFAATLVILLAILVISCLLSAFLCMRHRSYGGDRSLMTSYDNPSYVHTSLKKSGFF